MKFTSSFTNMGITEVDSLVFQYGEQSIYLLPDPDNHPEKSIPRINGKPSEDFTFFGILDGYGCYCRKATEAPVGTIPVRTRDLLESFPEVLSTAIIKGQVLSYWTASTRFCGFCGTVTERDPGEWARVCPTCNNRFYPKMSPAVIVRITDGERILLARNLNHRGGVFSNVAGFVDPGESLEKAVHREVMEEVGITVKNLRYFGSQPWTVTQSIIMAFTADYAGGEICPDGLEIVEAGWFTADRMPPLPSAGSISRKMIDDFTKNGLT
jgi:NAD+ diphosphatase